MTTTGTISPTSDREGHSRAQRPSAHLGYGLAAGPTLPSPTAQVQGIGYAGNCSAWGKFASRHYFLSILMTKFMTRRVRMSRQLHFISLGAGVQSSVMLAMADRGLITPRPEGAIFADTGWEPAQIYRHLAWLTENVSIPVHIIKVGDLYDNVWNGQNLTGQNFTDIPVYADTPNGARLSRRTCTQNYKIKPVRRKVRELVGVGPRTWLASGTAVQWIGISRDEWHREKPSGVAWVSNRFPLLELDMTRQDCLQWWAEHYPNQPLAKSSCVGCPFHSDRQWLDLMRSEPEAMAKTVELDHRLRDPERPVNPNTNMFQEYLHRSLRPLEDVLTELDKQDKAQGHLFDLDGFGNECEGVCGV